MEGDYETAHTARLLSSIIGIILLILGLITFSIGLLIFIGVNLISYILPKYIVSGLLPQDITFIDGITIAFGISTIIFSRLFHSSSKWIKNNERKGGLLAILISVTSIIILSFFATYLNFTFLGYIVYILILAFIGIIVSVILNWKKMVDKTTEILPSVGYFIAAIFVIFLIFAGLYMLFPYQLSVISSTSSSSIFSIFSGNFGLKTVYSQKLNYTYPASMVSINLTGIISSTTAAFSLNNISHNNTSTKLIQNTSLNLLLPNSFILSSIGNSPEFIYNLKSMNISYYLKLKNISSARSYLENNFPPLNQLYFELVGYQNLNSSYNVSIFDTSPSKFEYYLRNINATYVNSSFPVNITNYIYSNKTYYNEFGKYLPSQLYLVNMSNHVGIELEYNQYKIFNITHIPFYSIYLSLYESNKTLCFGLGADFSPSNERIFNASYSITRSTLKCS